jgi:hypothetical protein
MIIVAIISSILALTYNKINWQEMDSEHQIKGETAE